ncbi:MAG: NADH-quinone oxidoreductase subunit NuoG [Anaerolineae bacterium]|nr:NADH-quinone oxidoreductase subunit NuoG [Anaerolineae bacterium]
MAQIYIDQKSYEIEDGQNLLQACLSLGCDLPYFCWHPALGSVGACRQCAVKQFRDEKDTRGKIVMACMTPAAHGTHLSINDPEAKEFRASVIEWLMINHPHDCPVCDEGGECHLQDMTVMTGHTYREFRFNKRTYRNQDLGPFINHEMNRCIQCYRCVRFYRDYASGRDFDVFAIHNHVYFGRHEDGVLENEFSGNLVEVCPTGVFTDKSFKHHYTRKWDLQTAPSVCVHCGLGCNTIPGERYGQLRRVRNRYHGEVNGYFLCDRGRYGYEFVNSDRRIRQSLLRHEGSDTARPVTKEIALQHVTPLLANRDRVIGLGSPRASLEANFALRTLVGPERFYLGVSETDFQLVATVLSILQEGPARSPSLHDVALADAVFILGEDVTNVAPMLALALRQSTRQQPMSIAEKLHIPGWDDAAVREAIQQEKGPLFVAAPYSTRLDDVATQTYRAAPDDLARLGFAVAHALNHNAPSVIDLPDEVLALAKNIAHALKGAKRPLIVSGTSCRGEAVLRAAANVAWALGENDRVAELCFIVPECNSLGLGLMGGKSINAAFKAVQAGMADTLIILENDLYRWTDPSFASTLLNSIDHVIVIGHLANATTQKAEVVLPAGAFAEADGILVNNEGRAQRFYQVFVPEGDIQASWRWLQEMMVGAGDPEARGWQTLDDITAALAKAMPRFKPILEIAPPAGFRVAGQKIPRQPHRYSGRTARYANIDVHEPKPPDDPNSPFSFSMEGYEGQPPAALIPRFWSPRWNSVQALNKFQSEVGGPLRDGDPGRRLIEPTPVENVTYFQDVPAAFEPQTDEWLVVPLYHIFGSEELSILTPGIAARAPQPYLGLSPEDAAKLQTVEGEEVELTLNSTVFRLPVKLMPTLPHGIAGLPAGLPDMPGIDWPAWGKILKGQKRE